MSEEKEVFEGWCIIELLGHRRLAGYVREQNIAGAGFLRLDVPAAKDSDPDIATQFYPPSSVYCITPTTEAVARAVGSKSRPEPVQRWELPGAPIASRTVEAEELYDHEQDHEHDEYSPL